MSLIALSDHLSLQDFQSGETAWSFRCAYSHASWFRNGPFSTAGQAGCDPALEFDSFHPRRARSPVAEDSDRGPTTSVNFSRNLASRDNLKVFTRCGLRL